MARRPVEGRDAGAGAGGRGEAEQADDGLVPLDRALAEIAEKHGDALVVRADRAKIVRCARVLTGVFQLDLAVGGGLPAGRLILISGEKNSAKSSLALLALADWQQRCHACFRYRAVWFGFLPAWAPWPCGCAEPRQQAALWCDAEGVWDAAWAEACGVVGVQVLGEPDDKAGGAARGPEEQANVYLIRPEYAEQTVDVFDALVRTREIGFSVLDSIAQLTPMIEIQKSSEAQQRGGAAILVNKFMRKITAAVAEGKNLGLQRTIVLLNQVREKITGMPTHGPVYVEPGGRGQTFNSSLWVRLRWAEYEWVGVDKRKGIPDNRAADFSRSTFKVRASKVSPPGTEGEFLLAVRPQEDGLLPTARSSDVDFTMQQARKLGLLRQRQKKHRLLLGHWNADGGFSGEDEAGAWDTDGAVRLALLTDRLLLATTQARITALTYREV